MSFASIAKNIFTTSNRKTAKGKWFQRAGLAGAATLAGTGLCSVVGSMFSSKSGGSEQQPNASSGMSSFFG